MGSTVSTTCATPGCTARPNGSAHHCATQQAGTRYDELTEAIQIIEQLANRPVQTRML